MKLITVSTGSEQGNCYLIESDDGRYTALDCGAKWKDVMVATGFSVYHLESALLTHKHQDHAAHAKDFIKNGIPVYTNAETAEGITGACVCKENSRKYLHRYNWFVPFAVPHTNTDGSDCKNFAYLICIDGEKFLYMSDWMYCEFDLSKFDINHFVIAVNYTDLDAEEGKSSHVLRGHSSLETTVDFLKTSMTGACKSISLCHLSERNADENLILDTIKNLVNDKINVNICKKGEVINL